MVSVLSKEDRLRINLLKQLMENYLVGKENFSDLSFKIKSLQRSIETLSEELLQDIFENWGEIEIIYAFMLAENRENLMDEEKQQVFEYVNNIKQITEKILEKNPMESEDAYTWSFAENK